MEPRRPIEWMVGPSSPEDPGGSVKVEDNCGPSCSALAPVMCGHFSAVGGGPNTLNILAAAPISTPGASNLPTPTPKKALTAQMPPDTSSYPRSVIDAAENHQFCWQKTTHIIQEMRRDITPRALPSPDASFTNRHLRGLSQPWSAPTWVLGLWTIHDLTLPEPSLPLDSFPLFRFH